MIRYLSGIGDPVHRLIVTLLVACLSTLYTEQKYHWVNDGDNQLLETNPKWKINW